MIVVQTCHCIPSMILLLLSLVKFDCCIIISSLALILPRWYSTPWSQIIYVILPRWFLPLSSLNDTSHYLPSMILLYLVELAHIFISTRFLFCSPHYFNSCLFALPPSSWVAFNDCPCLSSTPPSLIQSNNRLSFFPHHRTITGACGNSKESPLRRQSPRRRSKQSPLLLLLRPRLPKQSPLLLLRRLRLLRPSPLLLLQATEAKPAAKPVETKPMETKPAAAPAAAKATDAKAAPAAKLRTRRHKGDGCDFMEMLLVVGCSYTL